MNKHEPTKDEYQKIAIGIANGCSVITLAGQIGVDRSTLAGWMKRDRFLETVAAALSSPLDLGEDALTNLLDERQQEGERASAYALRRDFASAVKAAHAEVFAELDTTERENAECARADQKYTIIALHTIEDRNWRDGTTDELAKGLTTPKQRRTHRCRYGIKWDFGPLGCYFTPRWDATCCRVRYADEDGVSWEDQRKRFGWAWPDRHDLFHPTEAVIKTNTRPLEVERDFRLPVSLDHAKSFLRRVMDGMGYAEACEAYRADLRREFDEWIKVKKHPDTRQG